MVIEQTVDIPADRALFTFFPEESLHPYVPSTAEKSEMRDIELINRHAERLNREAVDVLSFQNIAL